MNLSKRLNLIISMVPECDTIADIGTDHGFVPISLVESGRAKHAVASDIVPGPVERALSHVREHQLTDRISVRQGPGLSTLSVGEADCIVIAGMGGLLMAEILDADFETAKSAKTLILSPHTEIPALRLYLSKYGFRIVEEEMVKEDGKFYVVMKAEPVEETELQTLSETELMYGPVLLQKRPEVFLEYLRHQKEKTQRLCRSLRTAKAKSGETEHLSKAIEEKEAELKTIKDILKECKMS